MSGIWVGTHEGLAHITADGIWEVFDRNNSGLPDKHIRTILSDDQGGLWMGTRFGGLVHMRENGYWKVYNTDNSSLPYDEVWALLSDEQGGVLVGTDGGLARGGEKEVDLLVKT
jgi:hypothetical protein